jgi:superfamily II DNA or RNA helicase
MFNVGMVQTLAARLKDPDPRDTPEKQLYQLGRQKSTLEMLTHFEFVILEEAHEASGNSYYDIMKYCKNAYYRLSLTATPNMKDSEEANMRLMACSGPVAIKVSEKMLIDRGILAKPYFKFIALPDNPPAFYKDDKGHTHKLFRSTPWQKAYEIGIVHNELRNSLIVREAKIARKYGLNIMILVRHKKHGEILKRMISNEKMRCEFIFGENDQDERKTALNALQTGKIDILIGSTILDVGVDVPAVGMIIVAGAGKAEVGTRQRIGRGLRRKKVGPNVALIVDFSDPYNHHLIAHSAQRKAIIESTEGFAEGIISGEFDYAKLGFKV